MKLILIDCRLGYYYLNSRIYLFSYSFIFLSSLIKNVLICDISKSITVLELNLKKQIRIIRWTLFIGL